VLRNWLGATPLGSFLQSHVAPGEPYVAPDAARAAAPLLQWDTVARIVEQAPAMFVVRDGRPSPGPDPTTFAAARRAFAGGYSLVLRACEEHDDGLGALAAAFERDLSGDVQVIAFCSPAGSGSFGWHYDCEEVFIAQTCGAKEYRLRRNTVNPRPAIDAMPRDMEFGRETSPDVLACTLAAGDWLYIPRGWWHVGRALTDSLGISTGVLLPEARGSRPPRPPAAARRHARTMLAAR
jgi:hypothetical protein